jgi:hypothetical protein
MEDVEFTCPHCGKPNAAANEEGAVEGPREYHAECWTAAAAAMTQWQIADAWAKSPLP